MVEAEVQRFIYRILASRISRLGASLQAFVIGTLIFLDVVRAIHIFSPFKEVIFIIAAANLMGGFLWTRTYLVTPEIVSPKCIKCGGLMYSSRLVCSSCRSVFEAGEQP
jgi:hypothetical protein